MMKASRSYPQSLFFRAKLTQKTRPCVAARRIGAAVRGYWLGRRRLDLDYWGYPQSWIRENPSTLFLFMDDNWRYPNIFGNTHVEITWKSATFNSYASFSEGHFTEFCCRWSLEPKRHEPLLI